MLGVGEPSAKDLVLDLLYTHQGAMPVQAFCGSAAYFGVPEQTVRVALNRLCAAGLLVRLARGTYGFSRAAQSVREEAESWRDADARTTRWKGAWIAVHCAEVSRSQRQSLRRHERALRLKGFRQLRRDLWVRPDNLLGGTALVERELRRLGLDASALVLGVSGLGPELTHQAVALWRVDELTKLYREQTRRLERSFKRLARLPDPLAGVEVVGVARDIIRQIRLDPLLPDELMPTGPRRELVAKMRRYETLGQQIWARLLAPHLDGVAPRP